MNLGGSVAKYSTRHPWSVTILMVLFTLILAITAALPSFWPETFRALNPLRVDTDPENMLPREEPVRMFHNTMKEEMALYDMVVLGVVNEKHPDGVFNPESLQKIFELTRYAGTLRWPSPEDPQTEIGVIAIDLIAPSTVDNIEQGDRPGFVNFEWLMKEPPKTRQEAIAVRDRAQRIPFLNGTLVSEDGKALCLYLPLTSKDLSSKIYDKLREKIATLQGEEEYHITGLPVAEDVFGVEMFKQMAISAPIAMMVVFLLMLFFFRKLTLIVSPMIVAMVCVLETMALLVITGNTIHIMSSMIPIFIMPIAVLDAVHILSEFFDRYQETRDTEKTIVRIMDSLFLPMLYTSLTTAVGFASLALVPIPPVQVFGLFVAFGVMMAWLWTITFIPAYVMFLKPASLQSFGALHKGEEAASTLLARLLLKTGVVTYRHAKPIVAAMALASVIAVYGIAKIQINDNPTRWFTSSHPIRVADRVLNRHFGGTYMAFLALEAGDDGQTPAQYVEGLKERLGQKQKELSAVKNIEPVFGSLLSKAELLARTAGSKEQVTRQLEVFADEMQFSAPDDRYEAWDKALSIVAEERGREQAFKQPRVLGFMEKLQAFLLDTGIVGKANSLTDIVKTVHRELVSGKEDAFVIPQTAGGVAQTLLQYQNSHRPQDLWHFVTPDYKRSVMWLQLKSGDNRDMEKVVQAVDRFMSGADLPAGFNLKHRWFGLTYINVIWQQKMVWGMLQAFLGSFIIVFLMMTFLYRSGLWGLLSMIPLTVTIASIYGAIGLVGKDYDMPVAVLSALSLGLAVDYAIHFLSRSRALYLEHGSWQATAGPVFGEPARAISRNAVVIGVGFLPLLAAPLMPYKTVGIFIAAILLTAGLASLLSLPAFITLMEPVLFPRTARFRWIADSITCILGSMAIVAAVAVNVGKYLHAGWTTMAWGSAIAVIGLFLFCYFVGRSRQRRIGFPLQEGELEAENQFRR